MTPPSMSLRRRILAVVFVMATAVVGGTIALPSAAAANPNCYGTSGVSRSGNYLYASGYSNCTYDVMVILARSRWYGTENVVQVLARKNQGPAFIDYNCSGTGTHTWWTYARTAGGTPGVPAGVILPGQSAEFTTTC